MKGFYLALIGAVMFLCDAASAQQATGPVATARVIMLRLYVSDLDRGEKFYHEVFGTTVVQKMGDNVRIMNFPGGVLPGIIMIKSAEEAKMNGSFLVQVPDVQATLDRAAANGGVLHNTHFAEKVEGMPAQSSHLTDPDGNIIEVLQIGKMK
jgi:predicted enzyme related to lactoylglutathione lyase